MELFGLVAAGNFAFTLVAFVVALSIIVAVHEYGHYIVGRWCGIHAEVFSLGFGRVLYSWVDKRGTRWQIAALPFGGYVKFLGDGDAASAPDHQFMASMDPSGIERTMHGAKLWRRSLTVAAGPVFNFILTVVILTGFFVWDGSPFDTLVIDKLKPLPVELGGGNLRKGDEIVEVAGQPVADFEGFSEAFDDLPLGTVEYTILRDGGRLTVEGPYIAPPIADDVSLQSAAIDAGLKAGDVIEVVDGQTIYSFKQLQDAVKAAEGSPVTLTIWREGTRFETTLTPRLRDIPDQDSDGGFRKQYLIGIVLQGTFFAPGHEPVGVFSAVGYAVQGLGAQISLSLNAIGKVMTGKISACNIQGPLGIGEAAGQAASQGLEKFIWFIAFLSTAVGMMNLFPIPVLDGGHLVFHAYEAVTGRAPSDAALKVMMSAGLALILTFMVFALTNDFFCP